MTPADSPRPFTERELPLDQPAFSLDKLRSAIQERLFWLESKLTPTREHGKPGRALYHSGILKREGYETVVAVLDVVDPSKLDDASTKHAASLAIGAGLELINALDSLVDATNKRMEGLSQEALLAYRLLELPISRTQKIARDQSLISDSNQFDTDIDLVRAIIKQASKNGALDALEKQVSDFLSH